MADMLKQCPCLPWFMVSIFILNAVVTPASEPQIESTIRRSIPYLQREGVAWIDQRGCVSCHQVPFMVWSLSAAKRQGFDVDADKLSQWQDWSTNVNSFVKSDPAADVDEAKTMAANIDTMNALLLAPRRDSDPSWRAKFADALIENQKPDGTWQACGQLPAQKRPKEETTRVTVAWTLLTISRLGREAGDVESAIAFVDEGEPATSTEWWVARLLLAAELGSDQVESLRTELRERQHDDGGWGWLSNDPSDALATGMALYAMHSTDESSGDDLCTRRGIEFLASTQRPDGSWDVPGTKTSTQKKSTPTASYWGTAWAVIGMLAAIED